MVIFGFSDSFAALSFGKFGKTVGIMWFLFGAACLDSAVWCFCLFWEPTINSYWITYLLFLLFGITNGIWQTSTNGKLTKILFTKCQQLACTN